MTETLAMILFAPIIAIFATIAVIFLGLLLCALLDALLR